MWIAKDSETASLGWKHHSEEAGCWNCIECCFHSTSGKLHLYFIRWMSFRFPPSFLLEWDVNFQGVYSNVWPANNMLWIIFIETWCHESDSVTAASYKGGVKRELKFWIYCKPSLSTSHRCKSYKLFCRSPDSTVVVPSRLIAHSVSRYQYKKVWNMPCRLYQAVMLFI